MFSSWVILHNLNLTNNAISSWTSDIIPQLREVWEKYDFLILFNFPEMFHDNFLLMNWEYVWGLAFSLIGSSNSFSRLQLLLLLFPITTSGEFVIDSTFPLTPKFINILSNHSSVSLTYILIIFPSYLCSMFN